MKKKILIMASILLVLVVLVVLGILSVAKKEVQNKNIPAKTEKLTIKDLEVVKTKETTSLSNNGLIVDNSTQEKENNVEVEKNNSIISENTIKEKDKNIDTTLSDNKVVKNEQKNEEEVESVWSVEREEEIPDTTKEIGYDMYQYFKGRAKDEGIKFPENKELESYLENEFMDHPETISPVEIEMLITTLKSMNNDMYEDYLRNGAKEDISFFGE